eukprot:COSAG05_NODE_22768_length_262_cov_0.950920_1_plen_49_part_10
MDTDRNIETELEVCKGVQVITQNFAQEILGIDAGTFLDTLIEKYPEAPA